MHQALLFAAALNYTRTQPDLVNRALDISFGPDRNPVVAPYDLL